jgi:hypothetical protein
MHLQDIGYAQTFQEAYERIENLYKVEEEHENPPVEDFLVWRDLRVFDGEVGSLLLFFLSVLALKCESLKQTAAYYYYIICQSSKRFQILTLSCLIASYFIVFRDPLVLMVHRLLHGVRSHARYVQP